MDYLELTKNDLEIQKKILYSYKQRLLLLPKGRLLTKNIRGKKRYYVWDKTTGKQTYTSDLVLIHDLKRRRFMEETVRRIESNLPRQEKLLNTYKPYDYTSVSQILSPSYIMTPSVSDPPTNLDGEHLNHLTTFGLTVRSKSEALIAELLYAEGIDFEYEKPLSLVAQDGRRFIVHPDFTTNTKTGNTVYWEHLGMFGNADYRRKTFVKLTDYFFNGITIGQNLIISMDSFDGTLDIMAIKKLIDAL